MNRETGAAGLLVAALAAVSLIACLLVVDVARVVSAQTQLAGAADAAALAAAPVTFSRFGTDGVPVRAAAAMAAANGAELIACTCVVDSSWSARTVTVTVGAVVDLVVLGDRLLTRRGAAEFRPIALVDQ